jgi:peptide subunit release factor RF-3
VQQQQSKLYVVPTDNRFLLQDKYKDNSCNTEWLHSSKQRGSSCTSMAMQQYSIHGCCMLRTSVYDQMHQRLTNEHDDDLETLRVLAEHSCCACICNAAKHNKTTSLQDVLAATISSMQQT